VVSFDIIKLKLSRFLSGFLYFPKHIYFFPAHPAGAYKELVMNMQKCSLVLTVFLAVFLVGCFNPTAVEVSPRETPVAAAAEPDGYEPFTVSVHIGEGEDRSIAGPDATRIKGSNIRNFIQVIVLNSANKVVAMAEDRRTNAGNNTADLGVKKIHYGDTYKILVLQGHWSRNGFESDGTTYKYVESEPPTLLAAGYKSQKITGSTTVNITCYPIWVDTKFTSTTPASTVEAALPDLGTSPKTALVPGNPWKAQWTVQRSDGNGLTDLITAAGGRSLFATETALGRIPPAASTSVNLSSPSIFSRTGNTISLEIAQYISQAGTEGAVNFNLKYVPFSLSSSGAWTGVTSGYFSGVPEWIIRNGVNDATQDANTTFAAASNWTGISNTPNGNGAVVFTADIVLPGGISAYKAWYVASSTGGFQGNDGNPGTKAQPLATVQAALTKMAAAYDGMWPGKTTNNPKYAGIVILDEVPVTAPITVDNTGSTYPPIVLTGESQTAGGKLQAKAAIGNEGTLLRLTNGAKVTLNSGLALAGVGKNSSTKINGVSVVGVGSEFTMNGGEISGNSTGNDGGGVSVAAGTFVMNGGEISGNSSLNNGGGVYVGTGTFTMNGGTISNNNASRACGGGVYIVDGDFTMEGGAIISGNSAYWGSGVCVSGSTTEFVMNGGTIWYNTGTTNGTERGHGGLAVITGAEFTMKGGAIRNNTGGDGGGIYIEGGIVTIEDGVITENTASNGGGIFARVTGTPATSTFIMKDGLISGNTATQQGGGLYLSATIFRKEFQGGTISNNTAGYGYSHQIYCGTGNISKYRDTAVGSSEFLEAVYNGSAYTSWSGTWQP
jgi:hypothetical protein